jgi:MFS superfamily sulfate permease-like transporter
MAMAAFLALGLVFGAPLLGGVPVASLVGVMLLVCRSTSGQDKRAKFPTSKAPISAVFHSFRLIFGRAIISRNGLEA